LIDGKQTLILNLFKFFKIKIRWKTNLIDKARDLALAGKSEVKASIFLVKKNDLIFFLI